MVRIMAPARRARFVEAPVCMMCDGATRDECRLEVHRCITAYGWFIQAVEAGAHNPDWAYTVGLSAGFDHPELIVVGLPYPDAGGLLNALGEQVRDGRRFAACEHIHLPGGGPADLLGVDPHQFVLSTFATWCDYYDCSAAPRPRAEALQVWMPYVTPLRLDTSRDALGADCSNRATRRRRQRRVPNRQRRSH